MIMTIGEAVLVIIGFLVTYGVAYIDRRNSIIREMKKSDME